MIFHVVLATAAGKAREVDVTALDAGMAADRAVETWHAEDAELDLITHVMARLLGDDHL